MSIHKICTNEFPVFSRCLTTRTVDPLCFGCANSCYEMTFFKRKSHFITAIEEREKKYVSAVVRFDQDGKMWPLVIEFEEGQKYPVDGIVDVRRAACQSVGGTGERHTCRIRGQESYLWFEKGRWFVAAKMR